MRPAGKASLTKPNETQARLSNGGLFRACLPTLLLGHGGMGGGYSFKRAGGMG